jgi:hypothetical protein
MAESRTLLFAGPDITDVALDGESIELDAATIAKLQTDDDPLEIGPRARFRIDAAGTAHDVGKPRSKSATKPDVVVDGEAYTASGTSVVARDTTSGKKRVVYDDDSALPSPIAAFAIHGRRLVVATNALIDEEGMCNRGSEVRWIDMDSGAAKLVSIASHAFDRIELHPTDRGILVVERAYRAFMGFDHLELARWDLDAERWRRSDLLTLQRWYPSGAVVHLRIDPDGTWTCGFEHGEVDGALLSRISSWSEKHQSMCNRWFSERQARGWLVGASGGWHAVDGARSPRAEAIAHLVSFVADAIPPLRTACG